MIRRSFTAVIEKNATFTADFSTEPYEAGWASEARWFLRVIEIAGTLRVTPQISPDGLFWCAEGSPPLVITQPGVYSAPLRHFGQWLRLAGEVRGENASVKTMVYLALKE
jgi:hypothetical protein